MWYVFVIDFLSWFFFLKLLAFFGLIGFFLCYCNGSFHEIFRTFVMNSSKFHRHDPFMLQKTTNLHDKKSHLQHQKVLIDRYYEFNNNCYDCIICI